MNLIEHLRQRGISYDALEHSTTYTAQGLAALEHIPGQNIAKPVVVSTDQGFVMCVLPASFRLDPDRAAAAIGAGEARLATEDEIGQLFPDCDLGAEPPLGEPYGLPTLMDESLRDDEYVVFQAGTHEQAVKMAREDYEQLAAARVARIAHHL